ncbi:hypothetical protein PF003_g26987 [Phytophthora fragariae]|nr:hypothetical protein PF003_g26987 [Phytophthora fragariae]
MNYSSEVIQYRGGDAAPQLPVGLLCGADPVGVMREEIELQ